MRPLVLLDAKGYPVPDDAKYTREDLFGKTTLDRQNPESGGFGRDRQAREDLDITSMTLQALAHLPRRRKGAEGH